MRNWIVLLGGLWCGVAGAAPLNPCLLTPAELAPVLGHEPQAGRAERDPLGTPMCIYETKGEIGKRFLLLAHPGGWDRKRYANRLSLAEGSGIRVAHKRPQDPCHPAQSGGDTAAGGCAGGGGFRFP